MKAKKSPIPSFLTIKFDSDLKLDNLSFSRIFNSNKGSIEVFKEIIVMFGKLIIFLLMNSNYQ